MRLLRLLDAHGPYLSRSDEAEILDRVANEYDVADLALRTCLCGARIDGFDAYHAHLRTVLSHQATELHGAESA